MKLGSLLYLLMVLGLCKACPSSKSTQKSANCLDETTKKEKSEIDKFFSELDSKINATCERNGAEDSVKRLRVTYREFGSCYYDKNRPPFNTSFIAKCSTGFKEALGNCLTEKEKYFAEFSLKLWKQFDKFQMINSSDEGFIEAVHNCVGVLRKEKHTAEWLKCLRDQFWTEGSDIFTIPPREKLCQKIRNFDVCIRKVVTNACEKNDNVTEQLEKFITYIETPCYRNSGNEAYMPDNFGTHVIIMILCITMLVDLL